MAKVSLARVLKKKNMTKYAFAKALGTDNSNVAKYFKAGYDPRLSTIEKWAKALDVSVKDLIED